MATFTILCDPQEAPLIQQELSARLLRAGQDLIDCVKFSSMGNGHLAINYVAGSGVDSDHVHAVFYGIDLFLVNIGFKRTDEGSWCFIYRR